MLNMEVDALIQAAGSGQRLGLGPKAFVMLGDKTLLEHTVNAVIPFAKKIIIAVATADLSRAKNLITLSNVEWIEGGESRSATTRRLIYASDANWVILHDVVHPFTKQKLFEDTLREAYQSGAAAAGIPNTNFLYGKDGRPLHPPGDVIVGQKPVAFNRESVIKAYEKHDPLIKQKDPSLLEILESVGINTRFVQGDSTNIKITTLSDLYLAEALLKLKND